MLLSFVDNREFSLDYSKLSNQSNNMAPTAKLPAKSLYLLRCSESLGSQQGEIISKLLAATPVAQLDFSQYLYILAKPTYNSPWGSKAVNICQHSGISTITRIERALALKLADLPPDYLPLLRQAKLYDPLTQCVLAQASQLDAYQQVPQPEALDHIPLDANFRQSLATTNADLSLGLSAVELDYLAGAYQQLGHGATTVELMMFAQVNSDHCRHKLFNSTWQLAPHGNTTLFQMIKNTAAKTPENILSAYKDNAAVFHAYDCNYFNITANGDYQLDQDEFALTLKVETHNHPTAISPYPGAATGSGGEIRDEAAVGRGGIPNFGLSAFMTSNLQFDPEFYSWETATPYPERIKNAATIMQDGPVGAARFNNEFGRPCLAGFFRSFELATSTTNYYGYHKPVMLAGGVGHIRSRDINKKTLSPGDLIIVLGGPAYRIGIGGGRISSQAQGEGGADLDFASVQREDPEMERRCQQVINACVALKAANPIISMHDVGAGGLSNAIPEILFESACGGIIDLTKIPCGDSSLSALELWCNEAQERYCLIIAPESLALFSELCRQENAVFANVGTVTTEANLVLHDPKTDTKAIDLPLAMLLEDLPLAAKTYALQEQVFADLNFSNITIETAATKVLAHPSVADKSFLITIADRSVGGLVVRDQFVGPYQVPVSDVAVSNNNYQDNTGVALSLGERSPLSILNAAASVRMAVAEAITNICACPIAALSDIKLSANWMVAGADGAEQAKLYEAVAELGLNFAPDLGLAIPVGKDSTSMQTNWRNDAQDYQVQAPMTVVITAAGPVADTSKCLTPELNLHAEPELWFIDLAPDNNNLGASILAQCTEQFGNQYPDISAKLLKQFFHCLQQLHAENILCAYHDRSDGGLFTTITEMAFASNLGLNIELDQSVPGLEYLFNENCGAVVQLHKDQAERFLELVTEYNLTATKIASFNQQQQIIVQQSGQTLFEQNLAELRQIWSRTSYEIMRRRDNPECAESWYDSLRQPQALTWCQTPTSDTDVRHRRQTPTSDTNVRHQRQTPKPKAAVLREQGINGYKEMAAALHFAGFEVIDLHTNLLTEQPELLATIDFLAVPGGFSYADVLGAGRGWAQKLLQQPALKAALAAFFADPNKLSFGVCNGCQLLAELAEIIPGSDHWPRLVANDSGQFESRLTQVTIPATKSIMFQGLQGTSLPVVVAHGEGKFEFAQEQSLAQLQQQQQTCLHYCDSEGAFVTNYPANPNGSPQGLAGCTNADGRITLLMPHPERIFKSAQCSWRPPEWGEYSPWFKLFLNAYEFFV